MSKGFDLFSGGNNNSNIPTFEQEDALYAGETITVFSRLYIYFTKIYFFNYLLI